MRIILDGRADVTRFFGLENAMRNVVGMIAHFPLIYIAGFLGLFAMPHETMFQLFPIIFPLHALMMLACLGLTLYYAVDALRDTTLDATQRLLWVLILMMGNLIAFPVYYWVRVHGRGGWETLEQDGA